MNPKEYKCNICCKFYASYKSLCDHTKKFHENVNNVNNNTNQNIIDDTNHTINDNIYDNIKNKTRYTIYEF